MPSITVDIPAGVPMTTIVQAADAAAGAVETILGHTVEANIDVADLERSASSGDLAEISRSQECAADAMAAKHGRSRVRRIGDGAVEIVGMLDDIEMEWVCIERDGRERWRR